MELLRPGTTATTSTTTMTPASASTPSTPASAGHRLGQVTSGTKIVLASKLGSPVSFQQDKNFQQSFASWVKQGQNNGSGRQEEDEEELSSSSSVSVHPSFRKQQPLGFPLFFFLVHLISVKVCFLHLTKCDWYQK